MKRTTDETALMIRYLLGDVSEDEQLRLEEQFFTDEDSYQQLTALEDELRYDYAQGNLTPRERQLFEKRFLTTPADRKKVDLAKAVLQKSSSSRCPCRWSPQRPQFRPWAPCCSSRRP